MPRGLKETSSTIGIGFGIAEGAANTFAQATIDLNLDPLNQEVFVVQSVNLANCLATARLDVRSTAPGDSVGFTRASTEAPSTGLEYIGIIATNNFFVQVQGQANLAAKSVTGKVYGYRARADAAIYSALVSSEVLSA